MKSNLSIVIFLGSLGFMEEMEERAGMQRQNGSLNDIGKSSFRFAEIPDAQDKKGEGGAEG